MQSCPGAYTKSCDLISCAGDTLQAYCMGTFVQKHSDENGCNFGGYINNNPIYTPTFPLPGPFVYCTNLQCNKTTLTGDRTMTQPRSTSLKGGCATSSATCPGATIINDNGTLDYA